MCKKGGQSDFLIEKNKIIVNCKIKEESFDRKRNHTTKNFP